MGKLTAAGLDSLARCELTPQDMVAAFELCKTDVIRVVQDNIRANQAAKIVKSTILPGRFQQPPNGG